MARANENHTTVLPVDPTRRGFLLQTAGVTAGGSALAMAIIPPALAAPATSLDASSASPALRAAAQALDEAHERLKAAKARFIEADAKVAEWSANNPEPLNRRARKKWLRKWYAIHNSAEVQDSWAAQLEAEKEFRTAQVAVADIKPRDMNELTLKACLSGVYDRVEASRSIAVIGYSVALDLVRLTIPARA